MEENSGQNITLSVNMRVIYVTESVHCLRSRNFCTNCSCSTRGMWQVRNISLNYSQVTAALCSSKYDPVINLHQSFALDLSRFRAHLTLWSAWHEHVKKHPSTSDSHLMAMIRSYTPSKVRGFVLSKPRYGKGRPTPPPTTAMIVEASAVAVSSMNV